MSCSVALLQDDTVLAELTLNIKKTHSERLIPLLDRMLIESGIERESLQAVAAAAGPGSFTGLRIGLATARALAQGLKIPGVSVGTLEALAEAAPAPNALICPILDARRHQVYSALYRRAPEEPFDLQTEIEPAALALEELAEQIRRYSEPVIFTGEGLNSYAPAFKDMLGSQAVLTTAPFRICRASYVALRARRILESDQLEEIMNAGFEALKPVYLRRSEAERLGPRHKKGGGAS